MLLQGSIHKFNFASVLQFLAQNASTGVLEVHDVEEYGFIYLCGGRVEGISLPITDEKLGTHLLKAGCLSEQQLAETLMEDSALTHDQNRLKPLGERLVERGFTSEASVREVMRRQTLDLVFELAHWRNGIFNYTEPEQMPYFQVAIQGDVQELLLDAQRRIDEGEQARKTGKVIDNEACFACPLHHKCSVAIKAKYLRDDVCLWRKMSAVVEDGGYDRLRDASQLHRRKGEDVRRTLSAVVEDDGYDRLRDARQPYRSRDEDAEAVLDAALDW